MHTKVNLENVRKAASSFGDVVLRTPLMPNHTQSQKWKANVFFKREDLQQVRSYKIRGAYHKISSLSKEELKNGVVCASAGNHAQGVALSSSKMSVQGVIFMPTPTPNQKVERVKMFGGSFVRVELIGDTFDDASAAAKEFSQRNGMAFIHPFDDEKVIEGQGTVGLEILDQASYPIDYLFLPVGGGGLASGVSSVFKLLSPETKIIGVEPMGAPSMSESITNRKNTRLDGIEKFIDGASVQMVGQRNFEICSDNLDQMVTVHEGKVCQTILDLYNKDALVVEPAGGMTVAVLDQFREQIAGKNVVCLISGSNNDITRTEEIKERALLYAGLKHYFIVNFPQRPGALKDFVSRVLGEGDNITHFEYSKKHNRNSGPAVIGLEIGNADDLNSLKMRMKNEGYAYRYLNDQPDLFEFLV
ncbi:threonine ammonia-lyase IlvA [Crocinitomicaceae bacterium]|nr:threonine ammonia-lyase IlvA [Crocinitomicaceae bacterium]